MAVSKAPVKKAPFRRQRNKSVKFLGFLGKK